MNKSLFFLIPLLVNPVFANTTAINLVSFKAPGAQGATPQPPKSIKDLDEGNNQTENSYNSNNTTNDANTTKDNNINTDVNSSDVGVPPAQGS